MMLIRLPALVVRAQFFVKLHTICVASLKKGNASGFNTQVAAGPETFKDPACQSQIRLKHLEGEHSERGPYNQQEPSTLTWSPMVTICPVRHGAYHPAVQFAETDTISGCHGSHMPTLWASDHIKDR